MVFSVFIIAKLPIAMLVPTFRQHQTEVVALTVHTAVMGFLKS